jgi:hypothetical protein
MFKSKALSYLNRHDSSLICRPVTNRNIYCLMMNRMKPRLLAKSLRISVRAGVEGCGVGTLAVAFWIAL